MTDSSQAPEPRPHTKGPWRIGSLLLTSGGFPTRHPHYEIVSQHSASWIAHVLCFSDANTGTQYEADANLIAAAPELLKELEHIYAQAESWHSMHHAQNLIQCDSICKAIPSMKKAIAKARGIAHET